MLICSELTTQSAQFFSLSYLSLILKIKFNLYTLLVLVKTNIWFFNYT